MIIFINASLLAAATTTAIAVPKLLAWHKEQQKKLALIPIPVERR